MTSTLIRTLIVTAACAVLVVAAWSYADSMIDDAYVVFRYADHEEQIAADPRFRAEYERVQVRIPAPGGTRWFAFYKRRDLAWAPGGARIGEAENP